MVVEILIAGAVKLKEYICRAVKLKEYKKMPKVVEVSESKMLSRINHGVSYYANVAKKKNKYKGSNLSDRDAKLAYSEFKRSPEMTLEELAIEYKVATVFMGVKLGTVNKLYRTCKGCSK